MTMWGRAKRTSDRPKFQKRHYEAIAGMLGKAQAPGFEVKIFIRELKKDNPQFKERVFKDYVDRNRPKRKKK